MRIGMFTAMEWSPEENRTNVLVALREQVHAARDNGFSVLIIGQHLLTARAEGMLFGVGESSADYWRSRRSARTSSMRRG